MSQATLSQSGTQSVRSGARPAAIRRSLPIWISAGLLAGLAIVYTGAVGMIVAFSKREVISDTLTLGQILLFLPVIVASYTVASRTARSECRSSSGVWLVEWVCRIFAAFAPDCYCRCD
ncbi:MAG: hypothetical protein R2867_05840 [Caldilineaceae bacterium]